MNDFEVRYVLKGHKQAKVWASYDDRATALRDAQALLRMSNVERCQIYEWVAINEAEELVEIAA